MDYELPRREISGCRNALYVFAAVSALALSLTLVWVIQLARQGDPVGYILLTGLGVLVTLPVIGAVLFMLILALGKAQRLQSPQAEDMRAMYESQRVIRSQNQELARLLQQLQRDPALLSQPIPTPPPRPILGPGQILTPEGFVIDGSTFNTLDDDTEN